MIQKLVKQYIKKLNYKKMENVKFEYYGNTYNIQCNKEEKLRIICQRFINKTLIDDQNSFYYLYQGNQINLDLTLNELLRSNSLSNNNADFSSNINNIKIIVSKIENSIPTEKVFYTPKFIICPQCGENARIKINNYTITIDKCKNNHTNSNISFEEFEETQKIDLSTIKCDKCKTNNRSNTHDNKFYRCMHCKINLCPLCKSGHSYTRHRIIDYEEKYFICDEHNELFVGYCNDCKKNLCVICEKYHYLHKRESYSLLFPKMEVIQNEINLLRTEIDKFNDSISNIINKLNEIKKSAEIYFNIYKKIMDDFDYSKRNYEILQNLNEINDNIILDFFLINGEEDLVEKFKKILNKKNKKGEEEEEKKKEDINIIYNIEQKSRDLGKIKLFGKNFVQTNKGNIKIEIKDKEYELMEEFAINNINEDKLEVKLKILKAINDLSFMFDNCLSLSSISNFSNFDTFKIININDMFNGCSSLKSLPDISKWNTSNILYMSNVFGKCSSLSSLPDISNWNTDNVEDMSFLFFKCSSLTSLPDISKWNVSKVKVMTDLFSDCSSLKSLPDISKWKTNNLQYMTDMFNGCSSLKYFPDISKWDTSNVLSMSHLFNRCSYIQSLPEISKWNTSNLQNMKCLFAECSSLEFLPDISNWKTSNVEDMSEMFNGCISIFAIPDIKGWDTGKVKNMSFMFAACNLLTYLPDISDWNTSNVENMSFMFAGCMALSSLPNISKWNISIHPDKSCMFEGCPDNLNIPLKFISSN